MEKKQLEKITIRGVDGRFPEEQASSWEEADSLISTRVFAGSGSVGTILDFGTEKIDYIYDMPNPAGSLRSSVRKWLEFMAGITRPSWMEDEEWKYFKIGQEGFADTYIEWLKVLDI